MDHFKHKRLYVPRRASEVIALVALSTTLFLFLHTSQLRERLRVAQQSAPASGSAPSMHQQVRTLNQAVKIFLRRTRFSDH
ncbi:hypothetical protein B566_EDAN013981 [Ephemera danica]|nr:hypothetical protein B566_EDAN013981 [Ephemera danica]